MHDFLTPHDAVQKILKNICTNDVEHVYVPSCVVSIWGRKRTLADKTVYQNGSFDTSFDQTLLSLDRTFNTENF
jgi:hypothetical protein